jgi:hypothetical protein
MLLAVAGMAAAIALVASERLALADPLPYTAPWSVVLSPCTGGVVGPGGFACQRAFGAPPMDGVVTGTNADRADVSAVAQATCTNCMVANASTSVHFSRPVTIPAGGPYTVCLTVSLAGVMQAEANDQATASGCAIFEPVGGPALLTIGCGAAPWNIVEPQPQPGIFPIGVGPMVTCTATNPVPPGQYEVTGYLNVTAKQAGPNTNPPVAGGDSDFFNQNPGYTQNPGFMVSGSFQVTQTVPALAMKHVALVACFLAGIGWIASRRRAAETRQ